MTKQEPKQDEPKQKQETNKTIEQQTKQQPPKGIEITDMKKFLETKKLEQAARSKENETKSNSAESHNKLTLKNQFQSALRDHLMGD